MKYKLTGIVNDPVTGSAYPFPMSTTGTTVAVVVAALGASALTSLGTLGIDALRARRSAKQDRLGALVLACDQVISSALKLALRSESLRKTMFVRSGLTEGIDIALHHRKPIDPMELGDWLMIDLGPMLDAQSRIWVYGNRDLIQGAAAVIEAAREVLAKSTSIASLTALNEAAASGHRFTAALGRLKSLPRDEESEGERQRAVTELGRTCRKFGGIMRTELKTADSEGIIRSFPEPTA